MELDFPLDGMLVRLIVEAVVRISSRLWNLNVLHRLAVGREERYETRSFLHLRKWLLVSISRDYTCLCLAFMTVAMD
jgi:hypothetical protein